MAKFSTSNIEVQRRSALVFGAGKMACGLLGKLLHESGYSVQFVARSRNIGAINARNGYALRVGPLETRHVTGATALSINDADEIVSTVANADIVFTAVGIDNIPAIAPLIARGLWRRLSQDARPINIIASENLPGTGAYLRHQIIGAASPRWGLLLDTYAGFSAALTRSIMTGGQQVNGEAQFIIDGEGDLTIDRQGLVGPAPRIARTSITEEFDALFLQKLSTINLSQAVAAYLGRREGCTLVDEAATHPHIAPIVRAAVGEAIAAFQTEFPHLGQRAARDAKDAISRIASPDLGDTVERICRGPMRKLGAQERLIGPARLAIKHGLPHDHLVQTIAAALTYHDERDVQSKVLQYVIGSEGLDYVLTAVCGLLPHEPLAQEVKVAWAALHAGERKKAELEIDRSHLVQKIIKEALADFDCDPASKTAARHMREISREFSSARVTAFLPILVRNKLRNRLGATARATA